MGAPGPSGDPNEIVPADRVELSPPPLGCAGGSSSVVPWTVTVPIPGPVTDPEVEVIARRSAVAGGTGTPVISTIRNRSRVTCPAVVLVNFLRKTNVPSVEVAGGPGVVSRNRLGLTVDATVGSSRLALITALR